jgi:hypothetical protein
MKKTLIIATIVVAGIIISAMIFGAGFFVGRANFGFAGNGPASMMSRGFNDNNRAYGMMGNGYNGTGGFGMMGNGYDGTGGFGMMGNGYDGTGGFGMMGGFGAGDNTNVEPISIEQAKQAVESYLSQLDNADLALTEIMIFDNNAYARITETSTGIDAMELLVDPSSLSVFPEYGPNMMWNLKYGHMSGNGMMGGMMGNAFRNSASPSATMTVTSEEAGAIAQSYLDEYYPGYTVSQEPDAFYGYFTLDILKDGEPTGMLSVHGFSGQVFLHTWHGTFIEMFE